MNRPIGIAVALLAVAAVRVAAADDAVAMSGPHRTPFDDTCAARRGDADTDYRCIPLVANPDAGLYAIVRSTASGRSIEYYVALHARGGWWTSTANVSFDLDGRFKWNMGSYIALVDTPAFAFAHATLAFATITQGIGFQYKPDYFSHRPRPTQRTMFVGDGIACGMVPGDETPVCAWIHLQCDDSMPPRWNARDDRITGTCPHDSDPEKTRTLTL